jgi:hypothetical protein
MSYGKNSWRDRKKVETDPEVAQGFYELDLDETEAIANGEYDPFYFKREEPNLPDSTECFRDPPYEEYWEKPEEPQTIARNLDEVPDNFWDDPDYVPMVDAGRLFATISRLKDRRWAQPGIQVGFSSQGIRDGTCNPENKDYLAPLAWIRARIGSVMDDVCSRDARLYLRALVEGEKILDSQNVRLVRAEEYQGEIFAHHWNPSDFEEDDYEQGLLLGYSINPSHRTDLGNSGRSTSELEEDNWPF